MENFNFKTPIQFRYSDYDMLGHLNSAQYVTLIELGRIKYFKHIGWNLKEVSNVVASFKIDYLNEIVPNEEVEVWVRTASMGSKSFKMEYLMASPITKTIFVRAESVQVCINKIEKVSTPIPDDIRASIANFDKI